MIFTKEQLERASRGTCFYCNHPTHLERDTAGNPCDMLDILVCINGQACIKRITKQQKGASCA